MTQHPLGPAQSVRPAGATVPVWTDLRAVVFDVDGTVLDSAPGIVAGFDHALRSVGLTPPDDATLRSDLGPPLALLLTSFGVGPDRLEDALAAYRAFYLREGRFMAAPYPGMAEVLDTLAGRLPLGTATAKRSDTALATLQAHDLVAPFTAVNGVDDQHTTKAETLAHTIEQLGAPDPTLVVMVGDRHSDVAAGRACGVRTVGVTWGYGSRAELAAADADVLLDHPEQLLELVAG